MGSSGSGGGDGRGGWRRSRRSSCGGGSWSGRHAGRSSQCGGAKHWRAREVALQTRLDLECGDLGVSVGIEQRTGFRGSEPRKIVARIPVDELDASRGVETGLNVN